MKAKFSNKQKKKAIKKADELITALSQEDLKHLMSAQVQSQVSTIASSHAVMAGKYATFKILYDTYLKPIVENKLTDNEAKESINGLISEINKGYLEYEITLAQQKQKIKEQEESINNE